MEGMRAQHARAQRQIAQPNSLKPQLIYSLSHTTSLSFPLHSFPFDPMFSPICMSIVQCISVILECNTSSCSRNPFIVLFFFLESALFNGNSYITRYITDYLRIKCQLVGDLPSALTGALKPGAWPGGEDKMPIYAHPLV